MTGALPPTTYSSDLSWQFFNDLIDVCGRLQCDPLNMLKPLYNESGLRSTAHNLNGNASGIFQSMPSTLVNEGFSGGWEAFVALSADQQLPWLEKYYRPYTGKLTTPTKVYAVTFCPAWVDYSDDSSFIICAADGRSSKLSSGTSKIWYSANKGFDHTGKGTIVFQDLTDAINRADQGNRWNEIVSRLDYVVQDRS